MSGMKKSNRKFRSLKMESLENRELMAADVRASLSAGTLTVTGTDRPDHVRIIQNQNTITVFRGHDTRNPLLSRPASEFTRMDIRLLGDKDRLEVNVAKNLDSVFVDMGRGSLEYAGLQFGQVRRLEVDARQSIHMSVNLRGQITDQAIVNFGSGDDDLNINSNSSVRSLTVNAGAGRDHVVLHSTRVSNARIDLGAGDDKFSNLWNSEVSSGTINGGSGTNTWVNRRFPGVTNANFKYFT